MSDSVAILGDINIDISVGRDHHQRQELKALIPKYYDLRNELNFTIVNKELTRFQANCEPSLIDHILTTKPQNVDNVITKPSIISDHMFLTCLYHVNELIESPSYLYKMEW